MNHQHKQLLYIRGSEDDLQCIQNVLKTPDSINEHLYSDDRTPLHRACYNCNFALVQLLLTAGADITVRDSIGNTSLHIASSMDNMHIVQLLMTAVKSETTRENAESRTSSYLSRSNHGISPRRHNSQFDGRKFINTTNFNFETALDLAKASHQADIVRFLIEYGAGSGGLLSACREHNVEKAVTIVRNSDTVSEDVGVRNAIGLTPLHYSTSSAVTVRILCANGADPNLTDGDDNTALHFLVESADSTDVIQTLVKNGAELNARNRQGKTPLHHACIRLEPRVIESLLQHGADANAQDNSGATALHYLAQYHKLYVDDYPIKILQKAMNNRILQRSMSEVYFKVLAVLSGYERNELNSVHVRGYNEYLTDKQDQRDYLVCRTLKLDWVIMENDIVNPYEADGKEHLDIIKMTQCNASTTNVRDITGRTPLLIAAANGHIAIMKYLVEHHKGDVCIKDSFGITALHEAVSIRHMNMVQFVIQESEMNLVNCRESYRGQTALHKAIKNDDVDMTEELTRHNADVNVADFTGNTPLQSAVEKRQLQLAMKLIRAGADTKVHNAVGNTLLHSTASISASKELIEFANFLLQNDPGPDVNEQNQVGRTSLHFAVWNVGLNSHNSTEMIKLLLEFGARVDIADDYGNTPLHVMDHMTGDAVELLVQHGADINVRNDRGMTPLHVACLTFRLPCVKKLLQYGSECNVVDGFGATPLHYACRQQSRYTNLGVCDSVIKVLLKHGADCNATTKVTGRAPLHVAAENDQLFPKTIEQIIRETDPSIVDALGNSILHCLSKNYDIFMPSLVSRLSHCRRNYCGLTCLHNDAKEGKSAWMGNNIPAEFSAIQDTFGRTCLHIALSCGYHLQQPLYASYDLFDVTDFMRRNCFHHMCIKSSFGEPCSESFLELVQNHPELINARDAYGRTPLFYAVIYQGRRFVDQLSSAGAEPKIPDNASTEDIKASVISSPRVIRNEFHGEQTPSMVRKGSNMQCTQVYQVWKTLQPRRVDESYRSILREKVRDFASRLMNRVATLDPLFKSSTELVGSSFEGTRADKTEDEFDFMIVLESFQCLLDYTSEHERFPMYIRLKCDDDLASQNVFQSYTDTASVVQPLLVKERLYSLLIQACYSPDVWRNTPFEYIRTKVVNNLYSPAVAVKLSLNNLLDEEQRLHFYSSNHISIDFVPAVPTNWKLSPDTDFGKYVKQHISETVDHRGFAVMKPHKYSIGNDADGYCPVTFIFLESEVIRQLPTVRAAYTMMKWVLFCNGVVDEEVKINKYAPKTCVIQCIVGNRFREETLREVTEESLVHCLQVILQQLWACVQNDSVQNVAMQERYQAVWKFEPFAGFMKAYTSRHGLLYSSDADDPELESPWYRTSHRPSDMQRSEIVPDKTKDVVAELRRSFRDLRTICEMFSVPTTSEGSDVLLECPPPSVAEPTRRDLIRYTIKYDDYTQEFYVNETAKALLTTSPHSITE